MWFSGHRSVKASEKQARVLKERRKDRLTERLLSPVLIRRIRISAIVSVF